MTGFRPQIRRAFRPRQRLAPGRDRRRGADRGGFERVERNPGPAECDARPRLSRGGLQPRRPPQAITKTGVDLNTATEAELSKLPGINKTMAKRIVMMRPFLSVNDLIRVGVSKKTIDNLKPAASGNGKAPTK
jgi:hypothetical protein